MPCPPQRVAQLRNDDSLHLAQTPSNDYWYLALNLARPPWNDVRVRQAVAYAIDRTSIVQATSYGTAQANQLAIPEGNPWFVPLRPLPTATSTRPKALLQEAGVDTVDDGPAGHHRVSADRHRRPGDRRQPCTPLASP